MEIQAHETESVSTPVQSGPSPAGQGLIAAVLILLLLVTATGLYIHREVPESWQYMIAAPKDGEFQEVMDRLGAAGWELVFARRASESGVPSSMSYEMIFKKRGAAPAPAGTAH
jgi:hypothetical protein